VSFFGGLSSGHSLPENSLFLAILRNGELPTREIVYSDIQYIIYHNTVFLALSGNTRLEKADSLFVDSTLH
jgi:hypothetical protein